MKRSTLLSLLCIPAFAVATASEAGSPSPLRQLSNSFAGVFEKAAPSVVVIEARSPSGQAAGGLPGGLEFFFRSPNGTPYRIVPDPQGDSAAPPNIGSGFVFSREGHILTNNHVIEGATDIKVKLRDGRRLTAELIGADERSDVAVLRIDADNLTVAELGDSDAVKVGELAFAIGTPMELPYTFTFGVVSAKGRTLGLGGHYDEFIQTDTSINPGNSGGPLCDIDGRVVGINTLISGINRGVGFAIPINTAKNIAGQLLGKGHVSRPWLGISIASLEEMKQLRSMFEGLESGVVVRGIEPGAPAQRSDLAPGDVITKVDGKPVQIASDLQREVLGKQIGESVELEVWRKGRTLRFMVPTGEHPDRLVRASTRPRKPSSQAASPALHGLSVEQPTPEGLKKWNIAPRATGGVLVTAVEPYSAAAVAGLQAGDLITEAAGQKVSTPGDLAKALSSADPERGLLVLIERAGAKTFAILSDLKN